MMRTTFLVLTVSILMISISACIKDTSCTPKTVQSEQAQILTYALDSGINGTTHSSGIYYEIVSPGTGPTPNSTSIVKVTYLGKLLDGTVFDSGSSPPAGWALSELIEGWRIGLPLISKGGSIKLIVPSSLGYGCSGFGTLPPNAILYFEITLVDVL